MHEHNPAVVHLAIHLENGRVYFTDANVQPKSPQSIWYNSDYFLHLMSGRRFCQDTDVFRSALLLPWNVFKKAFLRHRRGEPVDSQPGIFRENMIGKLYTMHPNLDECFFLRMLLVNVPGPRSFQKLKIVDSVTHATLRAMLWIYWRTTNSGIYVLMMPATLHIQTKFAHYSQFYWPLVSLHLPQSYGKDIDRIWLRICCLEYT
jgi:hypothetical protein